jgi:selenide, water dikinase
MTNEHNEIKLTSLTKGGGCGCKISPAVLQELLKSSEDFPADSRLIVGNEHNDDASVIDLKTGQYLISTTDFFMPIVDDAKTFGKIAAANALSDVYAMGGKPLTALAILGWPVEKLPASLASEVLDGARFMCRMAGISLAGGHSIESAEPFFGLAVNGLVGQHALKKNSTAQEGDLIFMTKPIGNGIITTAAKKGKAIQSDVDEAISYMCELNKIGERFGELHGVHALTDITGFGLAGHLIEMCEGSGLSAEIAFEKVPVYPFIKSYLDQFIYPDMTTKNYAHYASKMSKLNAQQLFTLCDPQTSGGLLVAVAPDAMNDYLQTCRDFSLPLAFQIPLGRFKQRAELLLEVV